MNNSGPGQYDNHVYTTFTNFNKPVSTKGYIFGARTAQRQFYQLKVFINSFKLWFIIHIQIHFNSKERAPSPTHYQNTEKKKTNPSLKPFNQSAKRFDKESKLIIPGYYY